MILGIDVSAYQGSPNWSAVAASGVQFAFARASRGLDVDARYSANRDAVPAAGLVPGAYHHLTPGLPAAQADGFVAHADPHAVHALDVEERALDVAGWVARYRTHFPSKPLVIYTGRDLWARSGGGDGAHHGALWLAGHLPGRYVAGTGTLPAQFAKVGSARGALPWGGWTEPTFMQFTDDARVPGISGPVDGDAFFGTLAQLQAFTGTGVVLTDAEVEAVALRVRDKLLAVTYGEDSPGHPFTLALLLGRLRVDLASAAALTAAAGADPAGDDARAHEELVRRLADGVAARLPVTLPPGGASELARLVADVLAGDLTALRQQRPGPH